MCRFKKCPRPSLGSYRHFLKKDALDKSQKVGAADGRSNEGESPLGKVPEAFQLQGARKAVLA